MLTHPRRGLAAYAALPQLAALCGLLFLGAYAAAVILRPSETYLRIQSNLVYNIVPLLALGLCVLPIRKSRGRERLGWLCLAALLVSWQIGDWTFTYYDFAKNVEPPFPGLTDLAYYPGYLAFIAAIPLLTFPEQRLRDRRWLIDAAIVMLVAGAIGWEFLMQPVLADSGGDTFAGAVALGYPLLDLALLTTLVVTLYASGGNVSMTVLLLAAAALSQITADSAYTYALTTTGYDNLGNPMELGWLAAYLLLAICFLIPSERIRRPATSRPSLAGLVLPYALALPLLSLLVLGAVRDHPSLVLLAATIAAVGLVVFRQFLTLRESFALLLRAANFDELTGLPNRRRFQDEIQRQRTRGRARDPTGAVIRIGIDDLKVVNDSLGHRAGDEVLVRAAEALRERCPERASLARLEGDEFALFLPGADARIANGTADELLHALRKRPVVMSDRVVRTTASAGIALLSRHSGAIDEMLSDADLAMDEAKAAGGDRARVYDPASARHALSEARWMWKQRISAALEHDRLVLHAQPIVGVRARELYEYELLLRMLDDDGVPLVPAEFLDVAERSGLILQIDRWVVREAIRLLSDQVRKGRPIRLAANLSGRAFDDPELLPLIRDELASSDARPELLTLEVTESAAIADLGRAQRFIANLKKLGCRFALDDFGVGFSSFSQLKHLPVDYLKIDGSFIRDLPRDQTDQHLVRAIVAIAHGLGQQTIAEFVQDEATMELLRGLGVDYGQGYYLGRPAPVEALLAQSDPAIARAA